MNFANLISAGSSALTLNMDENNSAPVTRVSRHISPSRESNSKPERQISKVLDPEKEAERRHVAEAQKAYGRGKKIPLGSVKDKKLRAKLRSLEEKYKDASLKSKDAEILLENESGFLEPEGELERTYKVRQDDILGDIGTETARLASFQLKLDGLGPYTVDYTRNSRSLLLAGKKGHVATMDWRDGKLGCELQLGETVRDAKWLHNDQYFAVAQKKYTYIYDHAGVELHCLQKHIETTYMEFLPYHFLLATVVSTYSGSNVSFSFFLADLYLGQFWPPQVHRYVDWADAHRDPNQTRYSNWTGPKSFKCYSSCWTPEWDCDTMVT
jgi:hypothetical protein